MSVKELIKRNVVHPVLSQKFDSAMGEVTSVDYETNTASVEVDNQFGEGILPLERVHIGLLGNGINLKGVRVGDYVMVEFTGGMVNNAKITSVLYHSYDDVKKDQEHKAQDIRFNTKEKFIDTIQTQHDLIFNGDEIEFKNSPPFDFEKEFNKVRNNIGAYKANEIGITHPISKATIKIEEDGTVFISNSSKNTITLKPNGEILINSKNVNIVSTDDINISSTKDINLNCANFNVNEKGAGDNLGF